jgi:hypothetical protein
MKISKSKKPIRIADEMESHYDFRNGEKPNYAQKFRSGATISIRSGNGRTVRKKTIETKSMIVLDSDVSKVFPDAKSVNAALRHLIAALPKKSAKSRGL